jgi:hypothetical protein
MDVKESRNMTEVKDALIAQVNGLGEKRIFRDHLLGDRIPGCPEFTPFSKRRNGLGGILLRRIGEEYNGLGDEV